MDRFVNTVRRDVPGCPNPLIKEEVLASAIEFCRRSWKYTADITVSVENGDAEVTVTLPVGTGLVGINHTDVDGYMDYRVDHEGPVITLKGVDSGDYDMIVNVSLKPLPTVTALPDFIFEDYYQAIAAGAKAKLMVMPGKEWTNPEYANLHSEVFQTGVRGAMRKAFRKTMPTDKRIENRSSWL